MSGHKSSTTKTETIVKETSNQQQENWLAKNPQYQAMVNNAINEASNYQINELQQAQLNPEIQSALANLSQGVDTSKYQEASDYLTQLGKQYTQQGQEGLNSAQGILSQYANWSQEDMQNAMQSEYNGDLVREQIAGATQDINDEMNAGIQDINHRAVNAGAMGSSRAGVAEGVTRGKALRAIGTASTQFRTNEESAAYQRLMGFVQTRTGAAGQQAQIAQTQLNYGTNAFNTGMGYQTQANNLTTQNAQNRLTAGEYMRNYEQQQLDLQNYNSMLRQSSSLQRLMYVNQGLSPIAGYQTFGNTTGNTQTNQNSKSTSSGGSALGGALGMVGTVAGGVVGSFFGPGGTVIGAQLGGMAGGMAGQAMG